MWERLRHLWRFKVLCRGDTCRYARILGVRVGKGCRILPNPVQVFGSEPYLVTLGDHVSITGGVRFVTHEGGVWVLRGKRPDIDSFGPIKVGDNVFIGINAIVMPNVTIGSNVIVAAGAVVTKDVPDGCIVAGVPARVLGDIEAYARRIEPNALDVRSWPAEKRKMFLLERFGLR